MDKYEEECSNDYTVEEDEMEIKQIDRKTDDNKYKVEVTTADGEIVVVELKTETNNRRLSVCNVVKRIN